MAREWALRRHLAEGISTPAIEHLLEMARALGAWGGKACGAGGGGCLAILAPPERREALAAALTAAGGTVLEAPPRGEPLWVGEGEAPA
jgi:D-glycero-alpha-D-manno-heptose-7-phosphate kinase